MEYFNTYSPAYLSAIKSGNAKYKIRLELLSDDEKSIGEITKDLSISAQGQININYEQITRRSCSLTLIDVEGKYRPHKNSGFWVNRKFRLWIGVVVNKVATYDRTEMETDIYWWSQGIFYTLSASVPNNRTISIEAIDKGGALDGALKLNLSDSQYLIKRGAMVSTVIKDTLALNVGASDLTNDNLIYGGDSPVDVAPPIIAIEYFTTPVMSDISVDANNYIGEVFTNLAELYAADCYYDRDGHFIFEPYIDSSGYKHVPTQWEFNDLSAFFEDTNYNYSYDGINVVTYYTNASEGGIVNVAWTAYNTNPLSPLCINSGIRRAESQEIPYYDTEIPDGQENDEAEIRAEQQTQAIKDCRAAANHYLVKHSLLGMQLSFNCPIIPHLDVNKTVGVSDKYAGIEDGIFIIQSISIPLSAAKMSVNVTNINWLPNDMSFEGVEEVVETEGE